MIEILTTTQVLSLFFGLYFISAGIGLFFDREAIPSMFETMIENSALGFIMGLVAFIVGAVIVSIHSQWEDFLGIVISSFGWIALAEGMLMLSLRKQFLGMFSFMVRSWSLVTGFAALAIVMGAALVWAGLQGF